MNHTPELLAGQRLMAGFDGTRMTPDLEEIIRSCRVGGLILFRRNIESPDQVRDLIGRAREIAREEGLPPLFMAVDQEGGVVARLKPPAFAPLPGAPSMASPGEAERFADSTARELSSLGFNMNMAPVMDWACPDLPSIMKERAFQGDPERVALMGCRVIRALQSGGILAVAKHFPGIGRTTLDSHLSMPVLEADPSLLEATDLIPFRAAVREGVAGVMLSHILYPGLDPQWPASLSAAVAGELLRKKMGFQGLSMTDDLDMGAIRLPMETCADRVLEAGIDLALICHPGPALKAAFDRMTRRIDGEASLAVQAQESLYRIMAAKERFVSTHP